LKVFESKKLQKFFTKTLVNELKDALVETSTKVESLKCALRRSEEKNIGLNFALACSENRSIHLKQNFYKNLALNAKRKAVDACRMAKKYKEVADFYERSKLHVFFIKIQI